MTGGIPLLPVLEEAAIESLDMVMGKDPHGYAQQDRRRIILALREQRERLENLGSQSAAAKTKRAPVMKADLSRPVPAEILREAEEAGI